MVEDVNSSLIGDNRKSNAVRLQIVPAQPKTLSHLPTRPAVDLAFHDLVYSVREGRRNREYTIQYIIYIFLFTLCCCCCCCYSYYYCCCVYLLNSSSSAAVLARGRVPDFIYFRLAQPFD